MIYIYINWKLKVTNKFKAEIQKYNFSEIKIMKKED